jgi:hypothetical protein
VTGPALAEVTDILERALALDYYNTDLHLRVADLYEEELGDDVRAYELRAEAYCWGIKCEPADAAGQPSASE